MAANLRLAKLQNLSEEDISQIDLLHIEREQIFEQMRNTDDSSVLKNYAKDLTSIEFKLQRLWKFSEDGNFHRWFEVPKCICPKLDNMERLGTKYRVIASQCPVHGG